MCFSEVRSEFYVVVAYCVVSIDFKLTKSVTTVVLLNIHPESQTFQLDVS